MVNLIPALIKKPRIVFLIDASGATLSAGLFSVINFLRPDLLSWPHHTIKALVILACCLAVYSWFCFLFLRKTYWVYLFIIACANLFYCSLTTGIVITHFNQVHTFGVVYFLVEISIVFMLVYLELTVAWLLRKQLVKV